MHQGAAHPTRPIPCGPFRLHLASRPAPIRGRVAPAPARSLAPPPRLEPPRPRSMLPAVVALLVVAALLVAAVAPIFRSTEVRPRAVGPRATTPYILDDRRRSGPLEPVRADPLRADAQGSHRGRDRGRARRVERVADVTGIEFAYDGLTERSPATVGPRISRVGTGIAGRRCWSPGCDPDDDRYPVLRRGTRRRGGGVAAAPARPAGRRLRQRLGGGRRRGSEPLGLQPAGRPGAGRAPRARPRARARPRQSIGNLMEPSGGGVTDIRARRPRRAGAPRARRRLPLTPTPAAS